MLTEAERELFARMVARFDMETALGHLGAFLAGGDEMGVVRDEDAADALNSVYVHVARLQGESAKLRELLCSVITEHEEQAKCHKTGIGIHTDQVGYHKNRAKRLRVTMGEGNE